jgi:pSer/pThr/pTyr-binding forkhead associated (FHA) protein
VRLIERGTTPEQTRSIFLTQPEFLIGRGPDCDLRLAEHSVSRHHCIVRQTPDGDVIALDLGSSNGTFVNGQRVRSPTPLHSGDELQLGAMCHFVVDFGDQSFRGLGLADVDPLATTQRELPRKEGEDGASAP